MQIFCLKKTLSNIIYLSLIVTIALLPLAPISSIAAEVKNNTSTVVLDNQAKTEVLETKSEPTVQTTLAENTETSPKAEATATTLLTENTETSPTPEATTTTPSTENTETSPTPEATTTTPSTESTETSPTPAVTTTIPSAKSTETSPTPEVTTTTPSAEDTETSPTPEVASKDDGEGMSTGMKYTLGIGGAVVAIVGIAALATGGSSDSSPTPPTEEQMLGPWTANANAVDGRTYSGTYTLYSGGSHSYDIYVSDGNHKVGSGAWKLVDYNFELRNYSGSTYRGTFAQGVKNTVTTYTTDGRWKNVLTK